MNQILALTIFNRCGTASGGSARPGLVIALVGVLLTSGCATTYRVDAFPADGQELVYENGAPTVIMHADELSVIVSRRESATTPFDRLQFHILFANHSAGTFTVTPQLISARDANGEPLTIPSREDLVRETNRKAAWAAFAAAMSTAGAGNTYGPDGYAYDATAAQVANLRADAQISGITASREATVNSLQSDYIANQTLRPGENYVTTFSVEKPRFRDGAADVVISVDINGESHAFRYRFERMK